MFKFPKHMSIHITHNGHKDYYQSVKEYLKEIYPHRQDICSTEQLNKMIEMDEIWEIQWYPTTPVSYYTVMAATFEDALEIALEMENNE